MAKIWYANFVDRNATSHAWWGPRPRANEDDVGAHSWLEQRQQQSYEKVTENPPELTTRSPIDDHQRAPARSSHRMPHSDEKASLSNLF